MLQDLPTAKRQLAHKARDERDLSGTLNIFLPGKKKKIVKLPCYTEKGEIWI